MAARRAIRPFDRLRGVSLSNHEVESLLYLAKPYSNMKCKHRHDLSDEPLYFRWVTVTIAAIANHSLQIGTKRTLNISTIQKTFICLELFVAAGLRFPSFR